MKNIFQSRSPKTALNGISFTFLKTSEMHLILQDFYKKVIVVKNCEKKYLKMHYVDVAHTLCGCCAYIHKRVISAFIRTLQIKLAPLSPAKKFDFEKHLAFKV